MTVREMKGRMFGDKILDTTISGEDEKKYRMSAFLSVANQKKRDNPNIPMQWCCTGPNHYAEMLALFREEMETNPDGELITEYVRIFGRRPTKSYTYKSRKVQAAEPVSAPPLENPKSQGRTLGQAIDAVVEILGGLAEHEQAIIINSAKAIISHEVKNANDRRTRMHEQRLVDTCREAIGQG